MTTPWSVTPIKKSQRISGPKSMTSRGHRYVSPNPTPSAARSKPGPRTCNEAGASGSFLIGIGSSRPACHNLSSCGCSVAAPLFVSTTTSFRPRLVSARRASDSPKPSSVTRRRKQGFLGPHTSPNGEPPGTTGRAPQKPMKRTPTRDDPPSLILFTAPSLPLPYRQVIPAYTGGYLVSSRTFVPPITPDAVRNTTPLCDSFLSFDTFLLDLCYPLATIEIDKEVIPISHTNERRSRVEHGSAKDDLHQERA